MKKLILCSLLLVLVGCGRGIPLAAGTQAEVDRICFTNAGTRNITVERGFAFSSTEAETNVEFVCNNGMKGNRWVRSIYGATVNSGSDTFAE